MGIAKNWGKIIKKTHIRYHWNVTTLCDNRFDITVAFGAKNHCDSIANHFCYSSGGKDCFAFGVIPAQCQMNVG